MFMLEGTLMGGWGPGGGGGTSSVFRIQNGNSFATLVPYDLDTVTRNRYLHHHCRCLPMNGQHKQSTRHWMLQKPEVAWGANTFGVKQQVLKPDLDS